ncbi:MAG TPA: transposase [Candidatus Acidoferrum sp.]|nr:transposase [Candidatus Acidoferrum sp.]
MRPANVHPSQTGPCIGAYGFCMPWGLKRYYGTGGLHFITCSCYRRKPLLGDPARRDLVLTVLERMRVRYRFAVIGYVVMPEHVHLLISEPLIGNPSKILQAVKLSVSRRLAFGGQFSGRFWQNRFYDFWMLTASGQMAQFYATMSPCQAQRPRLTANMPKELIGSSTIFARIWIAR